MHGPSVRRREVLARLGALGLLNAVPASAAQSPIIDTQVDVVALVRQRAAHLAREPFAPPAERLPPALAAIGYDEYRDLQFKRERAIWHGQGVGFELQFLPAAYIYRSPVEIYLVE